MEKYRLKYLLLLSLISHFGMALAEESPSTYLFEKIALNAEPKKACLYRVTSDFNVVESCRSTYFKLGDLSQAKSEARYLFLHEFNRIDIKDLRYVWSMFYLENGQLVSTRLHVPKEERIVRGGMNSILEGELLAMARNLEIEKLKFKSLNEDLELLLANKERLGLIETALESFQKKQNNEFKKLLAIKSIKMNAGAHEGKKVDKRGELGEQLRAVLNVQIK